MGTIYIIDAKTNEEEEIDHENVITLESGFHIVQDFKEIKSPTIAKLKKALKEGHRVHKAEAYGGGSDDTLYFTGSVIWSNTELYETSNFAGIGMSLGPVPAGTLVICVGDD